MIITENNNGNHTAEEIAAHAAARDKCLRALKAAGGVLPEGDILTAFSFNLPDRAAPGGVLSEVNGICVLGSKELSVYIDGERVKNITLSDAQSFRVTPGVGSVSAECTLGGSDTLICRADSSHTEELGAAMKQTDLYARTGEFRAELAADTAKTCEKCGRPLPPGSTSCPYCADKFKMIRRLFAVAAPYKWHMALSVLLFFVITAVDMLIPQINRIIVDDFIKAPDPGSVVLWQFAAVVSSIAVVKIVSNVLFIFRNRALVYTGSRVIVSLRETVFAKIQEMSLARISKRTAGELMNRVNNDTVQMQQFLTNTMPDIIEQGLILIAVGVMLFFCDWRLALMIICPAPLVVAACALFWSSIRRIWDKSWHTYSKADAVLHDIFSGIRVVKAYGTEEREAVRYRSASAQYRDISLKGELLWSRVWPWLRFLMGIGEFFLLFYVGNRILGGTMTLGEMSQFSAYVSMIYGPLRWIAALPRRIVQFMTSTAKVFEIIDEKIDVPDRTDALEMKIRGTVDFEDVSFGYDKASEVLRGIDLHIEPGEMIGIVGKSGVGKTTLINLLMRIYDVTGGSIKIDGTDIRDMSQQSLRSQIGVVLQETFLFAGSVYDNIAYAKPDASRDEIIAAAKISGAHEFIMKLPDAYNTKVGEKGCTLSGGERQRVSIARALLRNPRILILDEATASLDTETERQIQDALQKLIKDRTTLAIAHRLSTLRNATRLIVLDDGKIAETGTHEELLRKKGIYYGLVMSQRSMSKMASDK